MTKILFDSITLHFSPSVFLSQLLHHTVFPLIVPFYVWRYGWTFLYTQGFLYTTSGGFTLGWLSLICFYVIVFLALFGSSNIEGEDAMWPLFLFAMHRCMVAFKYATLSPSEYRRIMCGGDGKESTRRIADLRLPSQDTIEKVISYQRQLQLNSGWNTLTPDILQYEMLVAATRCGIRLDNSYFVIANPNSGDHQRLQFERWQLFLSKTLSSNCCETGPCFSDHFSLTSDGSYRVRLHSVAMAAMLAACSCENHRWVFLLNIGLALVNAAIPLVMRYGQIGCDQPTPGSSGEVLLFYSATSLLTVTYFVALLTFIYGAMIDVIRRFLLSDVLQHLIRLVDIDLRPQLRFEAVPTDGTSHRQTEKKLIREAYLFSGQRFSSHSKDRHVMDIVDGSSTCDEKLLAVEQGDASNGIYDADSSVKRMYSESLEPFSRDALAGLCVPQLDLQVPANYTALVQCRKMLHSFGFRVRFRLDTYTGLVILLIFILTLSLISRILHQNPRELFESTVVVQTLFFIVIFATSMATIVFIAHLANKKMQYHRYTISGHITNMQQDMQARMEGRLVSSSPSQWFLPSAPPQGGKAHTLPVPPNTSNTAGVDGVHMSQNDGGYSHTHSMLLAENIKAAHMCLESLEVMDCIEPIKIMGIKCEARHAAWIVYMLLVLMFVMFQYAFAGKVSFTG